ncbi:hypothetical protein SODG_002690 [Sodalis praecaptivus]
MEYDPDTGALTAHGIKTAEIQANESVAVMTPVVLVTASERITLDTPEVVCTRHLRARTLNITEGGTMQGTITHSGSSLTSNGVTLDTHRHGGVKGGGELSEGPSGAYQFHGRSADGRVADISVISPQPACVTVSVLSREGDGTASPELVAKVAAALNADTVRPVADRVTVQSARIIPYEVEAVLHLLPGPEAGPIRQAAEQRLDAYARDQHRLGRDIRLSALYAALHVEGVQRVVLKRPEADIVLDATQASYCQRHTLTLGGSDA